MAITRVSFVTQVKGALVLDSASYRFPAQSPGGSLIVGSNSITLSPVPPGINGTDANHYLYISGGVGTAEAVQITGGTAVAGASSGTIIVTCANTHSGSWTIQSDSGGIREAVIDNPNGSIIQIPSNTTIQVGAAPGIYVDTPYTTIQGTGWSSVVKSRDNTGAVSVFYVPNNTVGVSFRNFKIDGNRDNFGTNPTFGEGIGGGGFGGGGVNDFVVDSMWITQCAKFGIAVGGYNVNQTFSNNRIDHNGGVTDSSGAGLGIAVLRLAPDLHAIGIRIIGNYFEHNHNTVTSAGPSGALFIAANQVIISGNDCKDNYNVTGGQIACGGANIVDNRIWISDSTTLTQNTCGIECAGNGFAINDNWLVNNPEGGVIVEFADAATGGQGTVTGNYIASSPSGVIIGTAAGAVANVTVSSNCVANVAGIGVQIHGDAASIAVIGNDLSLTLTPIADNSIAGAFMSGNIPWAANKPYGGSFTVSALASHQFVQGEVVTVTGSGTIVTMLLLSQWLSTPGAGVSVTLIPAAGATWTTGTSDNVGLASTAVPGKAMIMTYDGSKFWPSY